MDGKELYRWLQSRESQYAIRDLDCGMLVYKYVIDGYWRTCYLVNTRMQTAYEIVGWNLLLKSFTKNDIDIWSECVARCLTMANVTKNDIIQVAYGYGLFSSLSF